MQSTYSWMGSRLHLVLEDKIAEGYNKVTDAFLSAQALHNAVNGTPWQIENPIMLLTVTDEDMQSYNAVGSVINLLIEINGGSLDIKEEDCTTDQLVKL